MASDLDYAKMIEIPLNTCKYQTKKGKSLFKKKKIISLINKKLKDEKPKDSHLSDNFNLNLYKNEGAAKTKINHTKKESKNDSSSSTPNLPTVYVDKKEKFKNALISAQVVAIFVLVSAIILTNVFWENSGMNTLFKSVFGSEQIATDNRSYNDFSLYLPVKGDNVNLNNGAIEIVGSYSLYPICDGKVSKVQNESDGSYTITLAHSDNFFSVIEGVNLVYFSVGEEVSRHLPVGYTNNSAKVYLYDKVKLLTDYAAVENSIVFNKWK